MLEKMNSVFDHYKGKTLMTHICSTKSPFFDIHMKVHKITQTKLLLNAEVKRKLATNS